MIVRLSCGVYDVQRGIAVRSLTMRTSRPQTLCRWHWRLLLVRVAVKRLCLEGLVRPQAPFSDTSECHSKPQVKLLSASSALDVASKMVSSVSASVDRWDAKVSVATVRTFNALFLVVLCVISAS